MKEYTDQIVEILDLLDGTDVAYIDTLPTLVRSSVLTALKAKLEAVGNSQVERLTPTKIYVVRYWAQHSYEKEYFGCLLRAANRLLDVQALWGTDSDAKINTVTVEWRPYECT